MLYGQGSTAGVVNMVTKRPQAEPMREIGISYGSHNRRQIQADFTGPIDENGEWLYRVVALGRRSEEHTSELQSLMRISYAVFCLKKKKQNTYVYHINSQQHI